MQFKSILNCFICACLFGISPAPASDQEDLPTIVVSAARTDRVKVQHASGIAVISREEIDSSGARSLAELLRGRAGIFISDPFGDGGNASIDMRGFGSTASANTLVMIDGRKLNFASDTGSLYLNNVNLDNVKQVEIIQGSAGILFGNMAVGGVINIITRVPEESFFQLGLGAGSYDSLESSARIEQLLNNGWSLRANMQGRDSENYRDNNETDINRLGMQLERNYSDGRFFLELDYLDEFVETPGALFMDEIAVSRRQSAAVYADDYQDLQSYTYRFGMEQEFGKNWLFSIETSYGDDERNAIQSSRTFGATTFNQVRQTLNINPKLVGKLDGHLLTLGVDYQRTDYLLSGPTLADQGVDQLIYAFYGQAVFDVAENLDIVAGVRHARVENDIVFFGGYELDDNVTIGLLGVNFTPAPGWRLFARADQNYRFAKVDEHTNLLGPPGPLNNQQGVTYDMGAQFSNNNYSAGIQLYQLDIDDEISLDSTPGFPVNVNLDETTRLGLSLYSELLLGEDWIAGFNYDFVDAEVSAGSYDGNLVPLVPENRARIFIEYSPWSELNLMLDAIYTDKQVYGGDFGNDFIKLDSYTVLNLTGLYEQAGWSVTWRINNLLNEEYSESGSIGNDGVNHLNCQPGFFAGFDCPAEFTAPERNLMVRLKVQL